MRSATCAERTRLFSRGAAPHTLPFVGCLAHGARTRVRPWTRPAPPLLQPRVRFLAASLNLRPPNMDRPRAQRKKNTGPLHNPLYKTAPCANWRSTGSCSYGEKCQFTHGAEEAEKWARIRMLQGQSLPHHHHQHRPPLQPVPPRPRGVPGTGVGGVGGGGAMGYAETAQQQQQQPPALRGYGALPVQNQPPPPMAMGAQNWKSPPPGFASPQSEPLMSTTASSTPSSAMARTPLSTRSQPQQQQQRNAGNAFTPPSFSFAATGAPVFPSSAAAPAFSSTPLYQRSTVSSASSMASMDSDDTTPLKRTPSSHFDSVPFFLPDVRRTASLPQMHSRVPPSGSGSSEVVSPSPSTMWPAPSHDRRLSVPVLPSLADLDSLDALADVRLQEDDSPTRNRLPNKMINEFL